MTEGDPTHLDSGAHRRAEAGVGQDRDRPTKGGSQGVVLEAAERGDGIPGPAGGWEAVGVGGARTEVERRTVLTGLGPQR